MANGRGNGAARAVTRCWQVGHSTTLICSHAASTRRHSALTLNTGKFSRKIRVEHKLTKGVRQDLLVLNYDCTNTFGFGVHAPTMSSKAKGSKKDGVGGGLVCAHCKKVGESGTMKRCGRCRRVSYCSLECQKLHWKGGGHKNVCGKEGSSGDRGDGVPGASGGVDTPPKHPCPICLENEDDAGDMGVCCTCGQTVCGSCKKSLEQRGVRNCPTCRAVLVLPAEESVRLLRQLLARPPGRHTPSAQYNLGVSYKNGNGVAKDDAEALRLYRLAADQGFAKAQFNLGICYGQGDGVVQDHAEAVPWYRLAADQGHGNAQVNVGGCYALGTGVAQDNAEAVRWYHLAADQGYADAQYNIGKSYQHGTGVVQDDAEAMRWFRLAADQGFASAQFTIGMCYADGAGVAQDDAEAIRWIRLAADQGFARAQTAVAILAEHGV
jgi:hypothetical protein